MPAPQIHYFRVQLALKEGIGGENKERVRGTAGHQQPTLATLSFPSIYGNHWIIYKPLPLALRESVCERGGICRAHHHHGVACCCGCLAGGSTGPRPVFLG